MNASSFNTPLLFIVFNRPDTTRKVFESIRQLRPTRLFITADGPRAHKPGEAALCAETLAIVSDIDWPCEVQTLYRTENLGCKYAVSAAIDWFFQNVEEGIILEDDDLPDPSFFTFCAEMLERYRYTPQIMHISGDNFQGTNREYHCEDSYYFSTVPHVWGWATWRRAWNFYQVEVDSWPEIRDSGVLKAFLPEAVAYRWSSLFQQYYERRIDSYDGQWALACMSQKGLSINPRVNLVSNIGFGAGATHAFDPNFAYANLPIASLTFPLTHPASIALHGRAEEYTHAYVFDINRTWQQKLKWIAKSRLPKLYLPMKALYYRLFRPMVRVHAQTTETGLI